MDIKSVTVDPPDGGSTNADTRSAITDNRSATVGGMSVSGQKGKQKKEMATCLEGDVKVSVEAMTYP